MRGWSTGSGCRVVRASHGVLIEKPALCRDLIAEFLRPDEPVTVAPVRRAG